MASLKTFDIRFRMTVARPRAKQPWRVRTGILVMRFGAWLCGTAWSPRVSVQPIRSPLI